MDYNIEEKEEKIPCVQLASSLFPRSCIFRIFVWIASIAVIRDITSIPWGGVFQPLYPDQQVYKLKITQKEILRCGHCYGYINKYCVFEKNNWLCSLCNHYNPIDKDIANKRYASSFSRAECAECNHNVYQLEMPLSQDEHFQHISKNSSQLAVCIVDCTSDEAYINSVKELMTHYVESLPDTMRFMLITIGDRIGMYDIHGSHIRALYTQLLSKPTNDQNGHYQCSDLPLLNVMSWEESTSLLAESRESILALVQQIRKQRGTCSLGSALSCLFDYLKYYCEQGVCLGGTIQVFLADTPTFGIGCLTKRYYIPKTNGQMTQFLMEDKSFYEAIGDISSSLSFSISLYYNTNYTQYIHLPSLYPMVYKTNGMIYSWNYSNQDSIRHLSSILSNYAKNSIGTQCLLRMRSNSGVSSSLIFYSPYVNEHSLYKNLYSIPVINKDTTAVFEFKYHATEGLSEEEDVVSHFQIAFEYTYVVLDHVIDQQGHLRCVTRPYRSLTIINYPFKYTDAPFDLYQTSNPLVCFDLLLHQLFPYYLSSGPDSIRQKLYVYLNSFYKLYAKTNKVQYDVYDIDLPSTSPLFIIPKYIYSLLQSSFLYQYQYMDSYIETADMIVHFPYSILSRYLYPVVYYYRDLNTVNKMNCQLSWDLTLQTECPICVYYSYDKFIIYYSNEAEHNSSIPYPPPEDCEIMKLYRSLQSQYNGIYSLTLYVWKSSEHANEFKSYFIEDAENQYIKVFNLFKKEQISIAQKELEQ